MVNNLLNFLFLFITLSLASVLCSILLFFARHHIVQKFAFYVMTGIGILLTFLSLDHLGSYTASCLMGFFTTISLAIALMGKFHKQFMLAKGLISLSVIVGVAALFLL